MSFLKKIKDKLTTPKVYLGISVPPPAEYGAGEEVHGEVFFVPKEEFDLVRLPVTLSCWETVKKTRTVHGDDEDDDEEYEEEYEDEEELHSEEVNVCGSMHALPVPDIRDTSYEEDGGITWRNNIAVARKFGYCFPFVFHIPANARASYKSIDRKVEWVVHPRMIFKGRQDKTCTKDGTLLVNRLWLLRKVRQT